MDLLHIHRLSLRDCDGQRAYRQAISRVMRGGEVVLDLGTGTGIHALFACQAGARRVYALEQGDVVHLAREVARANGFDDRIVFVQARSWEAELPEKIDVLIAHLGFHRHLSFLIDARDRFLKPAGALIPAATEILGVPVESPLLYEDLIDSWSGRPYDIDFSAARRCAAHQIYPSLLEAAQFLSNPQSLSRVDFRTHAQPKLGGNASYPIVRAGRLHALGVWFEHTLADGIFFSPDPTRAGSPLIWGPVLLPVEAPIDVEIGDRLDVAIKIAAFPPMEGIWAWKLVHLRDGEPRERRTGSTFHAYPLPRGERIDRRDLAPRGFTPSA